MVCGMHYGRNGSPQNPLSRKGLYPCAICCSSTYYLFLSSTPSPFPCNEYTRTVKIEARNWIPEVRVNGNSALLIWTKLKMKNRCTELFHTNQLPCFKTHSHSTSRSSDVILIYSIEYKHYDSTLTILLTTLQRKNTIPNKKIKIKKILIWPIWFL